ncbi:MAG: lamin tail domain-containing protein [Candidatus Nanohaloarchaea archaeon]
MAAIPQAAIAASVIVGLLSVPVASQQVEMTGAATAELPDVSTSESVPKEVSRTTTPEGFRATVETAFNSFRTSISSGKANVTLENAGSELEVQRTPGRTEWSLTTPQGTLTIKESSERTVEKVSTPHGDLRIVVEEGSRETSFSGSERRKVEQARRELHQLLEQKKKELQDRKQRLRKRAMPDIEVIANSSTATSSDSSGSPEHVVIVNREFEPVNLEGWTLSDTSSTHEFGDVTVEAGEKLRVYTDSDSAVDEQEPAIFDSGISWNDGGDTAVLRNADGQEIDRESY